MLERILAATRHRIATLDLEEQRTAAEAAAPVRGFGAALRQPGLSVVAEVKRRSPSRGDLAPDLDPVDQAMRYARGGAAAISVLTEPEFFSGTLADLAAVHATTDLPVLRKDFIIIPAQVWEARAHGADAVLLIVAALSEQQLAELIGETAEAGMDALVEVHDAREVEEARIAGAAIVGVNNRDLTTFEVDLAVAERLGPHLDFATGVAESGIAGPQDSARMTAAGYDAVLVGEAIVRAPDPAAFLTELRTASS